MTDRVLATTRYLKLIDRDGWFFVARGAGSGVITLIALTDDGKLVLVEQHRPALASAVIELPAGLAGDEVGSEDEPLVEAARRELLEETGYRAATLEQLAACPTSPGLSDEVVTFFLARGLEKVTAGGGIVGENITVHEIPWKDVVSWLAARAAGGTPIAAQVYAGLFFAARVLGLP